MGKKRKRNKRLAAQKQELLPRAIKQPRKGLMAVLTSREFKAAQTTRLTWSWQTHGGSLDQDIYMSLDILRARSRDMYNNNEYAKRFISRIKKKCIGHKGIALQVNALRPNGVIDQPDSRMVETAWNSWSKKGNYDVTTKFSRAKGEQLMLHHIVQDGECLIRILRGYGNEFGYALQFLAPERLDIRLNRLEPNGNRIVMGVEKDRFDRPVAYWILKNHPQPWMTEQRAPEAQEHERIPASDIIHEFLPIRAEQTRGVPWMHASMMSLNDAGGYKEAAIIASRVGANKLGFVRENSLEGYTGQDTDEQGNPLEMSEPGTFGTLKADEELVDWSPEYPHAQFEMFMKTVLKGISVGFDTTYHALSGDLEGVNYSSARAGDRDEFDMLTDTQQIIVDIDERIFPDWLQYELDTGRMNAPPSLFSKLNAASWHPKRWQEIDPNRTAQANDLNLKNDLDSEIRIITDQQGRDPEQVLMERQQFQEWKRMLGLVEEDAVSE